MNFREVLHMLGMVAMPDGTVGVEGAGVVTRVDEDVIDFTPGQHTFGWIGANFCSYSQPLAAALVRISSNFALEEASTMYTGMSYSLYAHMYVSETDV